MAEPYVLITPARNEARDIGRTIESVLAQTVRPALWVIVSDGSTDETDTIVGGYAERHAWIRLLRAEAMGGENFGSKVKAFQAGYATIGPIDYGFIGNLDADVSFAPDYFERLLAKFDADPELGLAGGCILEEIDGTFRARHTHPGSVAGAVQLFRRNVYEAFGGYVPQAVGGIDSIAEIKTRMVGWKVRTFDDLPVKHHGRVTGRQGNILMSRFKKGVINYHLGYAPLFHVLVSLYRMRNRPWLVGGVMMLAGYIWSGVRRPRRTVSGEFVAFVRREQRDRLRAAFGAKPARSKPQPLSQDHR